MTVNGNGGRPVGLPKTGGRQKGTPNRRTIGIQEKLDLIGLSARGTRKDRAERKNPTRFPSPMFK